MTFVEADGSRDGEQGMATPTHQEGPEKTAPVRGDWREAC